MIKISPNKAKTLTFGISFDSGSPSEIQEGRLILSLPNLDYKLMLNAIIENDSITVNVPPLDICESSGNCTLEIVSKTKECYQVFTDTIKFEKGISIKVTEQKDSRKPVVEIKDSTSKSKKKVSTETKTMYRTIKLDRKSVQGILESKKMLMKPDAGKKMAFYQDSSQLFNDTENIEYGVCIVTNVPESAILSEKIDKTIVDSSQLGKLTEKNIMYLIQEGNLKDFREMINVS